MTFQELLNLTFPTILLLIVFFCVGIISFFKIKEVKHFYFGTIDMGILSFACNIFGSNFSFITAIFVLLFWSYNFGWDVLWTVGTAIVGMIIFSLPKITPLSEEFLKGGSTLHEYISGQSESFRSVRVVSASVTVLTMTGFVAAQVYIFAGFLSMFINIQPLYISLVIFVFLIGYTLLGGFDSVVRTDVLQSILIGSGCVALFIIVHNLATTVDLKITKLSFNTLPPFYLPMLIVINGLWQFSAMDMWQRSRASKNIKVVRTGSALGSMFFLIAAIFIIILGWYMRASHIQVGTQLVSDPFKLISTIIVPQSFLSTVLFALFVSAFLSTADSMLIAASLALMVDIYKVNTGKSITLKGCRLSILGLGVVCFIFNLLIFKFFPGELVVSFLLTFFSCQIVLLPSIGVRSFMSFIKFKHYPMLSSILCGLISSLLMGILTIKNPNIQNFIPVASLFISGVVLFSTLPSFLIKENNE